MSPPNEEASSQSKRETGKSSKRVSILSSFSALLRRRRNTDESAREKKTSANSTTSSHTPHRTPKATYTGDNISNVGNNNDNSNNNNNSNNNSTNTHNQTDYDGTDYNHRRKKEKKPASSPHYHRRRSKLSSSSSSPSSVTSSASLSSSPSSHSETLFSQLKLMVDQSHETKAEKKLEKNEVAESDNRNLSANNTCEPYGIGLGGIASVPCREVLYPCRDHIGATGDFDHSVSRAQQEATRYGSGTISSALSSCMSTSLHPTVSSSSSSSHWRKQDRPFSPPSTLRSSCSAADAKDRLSANVENLKRLEASTQRLTEEASTFMKMSSDLRKKYYS